MPLPQLKKLSSETGLTIKQLEEYWEQAKKQAHKKFKVEDEDFYRYVYGITSNRAHNKRIQQGKTRYRETSIVNNTNSANIVFKRMQATVLDIDNGYAPFTQSCYYFVCRRIHVRRDANHELLGTDVIVLLTRGNSKTPLHSILLDKNKRIVEDSYFKYRTNSDTEKGIYEYDIPKFGPITYKTLATMMVKNLAKY